MVYMKTLKNYWFLQDPIDIEHKFYILMDFLQSVETDINQNKYNEQIQKIRRIYEDLKSFKNNQTLSDKSLISMTPDELELLKEIQLKSSEKSEELGILLDNSIEIMEGFMDKISPIVEEINKSIIAYEHEPANSFKDQGFLVLRINKSRKMKIYSWMFSFVKVKKKDQIGILITELLDPLPKFSKVDKKIIDFFHTEINVYNPSTHSFVFVDLDESDKGIEIGFDLMKEKGIEFIVETYRGFLSS